MPIRARDRAERDPIARDLAALRQAGGDPRSRGSLDLIAKVIAGRNAHTVAAAARIVADAVLVELAETVATAFGRWLDGGADPSCVAKTALAEALQRLEHPDAGPFLRGIAVVQREAVWGGTVESAAELRGICALGLAPLRDPRGLAAITKLLVDPEWTARLHAARALGATGLAEAEAILRFKALAGDAEPQVTGEVFASLLALAPRDGLGFVAGFLETPPSDEGTQHHVTADSKPAVGPHCTCCGRFVVASSDSVSDTAAMALGQSRHAEALAILKAWDAKLPPDRRRVSLLAIAMLRAGAAIDHVVDVVASGTIEEATAAVAALGVRGHDEALRRRVQEAVDARKSRPLAKAFQEAFPGHDDG